MSAASQFGIFELNYPNILISNQDNPKIQRLPDAEGGLCIVYCDQELTLENRLIVRVDKINSDSFLHILNEEDSHSMKIGVTDCPPHSLDDFPFHLYEACKPDYDCRGNSITVTITEVSNERDEVMLEKLEGGIIRVQVRGKTVFNLQDPHSSLFKPRDNRVYPFLMLSGSVEAVSLVGTQAQMPNAVNPLGVVREPGTCVICFEHEIDHMAQPCNHAAFCGRDATAQMAKDEKRCPICRNPVTCFTRIFLS